MLARRCPGKVQLAKESSWDGDTSVDLMGLVGRVVGLDEEGVFRSVVSFV